MATWLASVKKTCSISGIQGLGLETRNVLSPKLLNPFRMAFRIVRVLLFSFPKVL